MAFVLLADAVVVLHGLFILFVVFGGLFALARPRIASFHVPAAAWGAAVEFGGWTCPLTPLEQWLRAAAGAASYESGFIAHYLLPVIYPAGLTREVQWLLGAAVVVVNAVTYGFVFARARRFAGRARQHVPGQE